MNTHEFSTGSGKASFSGLTGFTPIDEPPAMQLPERWRTWGRRGAMFYASLVVVFLLVIGSYGGHYVSMEWEDLPIVVPAICLWAGIGWLNGAFLGWGADRTYRKRDEERLADSERREEENRIWGSWLQRKDSTQ